MKNLSLKSILLLGLFISSPLFAETEENTPFPQRGEIIKLDKNIFSPDQKIPSMDSILSEKNSLLEEYKASNPPYCSTIAYQTDSDTEHFKINEEMKAIDEKFDNCLIHLILTSGSMNSEERKYWLNSLSTMSYHQIKALYDVLQKENIAFNIVNDQFKADVSSSALQKIVTKMEAKDYQKNIEDLQEVNDIFYNKYWSYFYPYYQSSILGNLNKILNIYADKATETKEYFEAYERLLDIVDYFNRKYHLKKNAYMANINYLALVNAKEAFQKKWIDQKQLATYYLNPTWYLLTSNSPENFEKIIPIFEEGIKTDPEYLPLYTNYAHALALLGREEEAKKVYLKYKGQKVKEDKLWDAEILNDFKMLQEENIHSPIFDEIKKDFQP